MFNGQLLFPYILFLLDHLLLIFCLQNTWFWNTWLSEHLVFRSLVSESEHFVFRTLVKHLVFGTRDFRNTWFSEPWLREHLFVGTLGCGNTWLLAVGTLGCGNTRLREHLATGTLGYGNTWLREQLVFGTTGFRNYWFHFNAFLWATNCL